MMREIMKAGKCRMLAAFFIVILTGCSLGPQVMKGNRLDYNVSVQRSNNEELLVNIVRARYVEPLFFLQVGSISSSFGYTSQVGLTGTVFERAQNQSYLNFITPSLGAGFSENPTITYSPLQGEKMVRQLQSELHLDRFLTLVRTGYSLEALIWLTVIQIGNIGNYGINDENSAESYSKFLDLAQMMGKMHMRGDLEIKKNEGCSGCLTMQLRYLDKKEADEMENLLAFRMERISSQDDRLVSVVNLSSVRDFLPCEGEKTKCRSIFIKMKSYQQMIYDMGLHVDLSNDVQSDKVSIPFKTPAEKVASRNGLHTGLVRIKSQLTQPASAFVAVPYRNRWFYIDDQDVKSKIFFMVLSSIFSLQSGDLPTTASPVLTLPVSR
ncbi:MAG TPA: hypothetical protein PKZ12_00645 [Smithellaceae bacterium]|nr:hypothetical protein [Smithellaceae bacterium]